MAFLYSPPPRSAVPYAAALKSGADQAPTEASAVRKPLGFASPPSNKENFASAPVLPTSEPLGQQHAAQRILSALGSLPSTPAAAAGSAELLLPQLAARLPGRACGMQLDCAEVEPEATTPVYTSSAGKSEGAGAV